MNRILTAVLLLGLATSAAQAQSRVVVNPPRPPVPITPVQPSLTWLDLQVSEVISMVDTVAETRVATVRLTNAATVTITVWFPATPPMWSFQPFVHPVPASLLTRALQSVQNNAGSYTLPFTIRVWRDRFTAGNYYAYSGSELQLFVPAPVHFPGNASTGGLTELKIAASGTLAVGSYLTWGYMTLENDGLNRRTYNFISSANTQNGQTAINFTAMEDLCSDVLQSPLWVGLTGVYKEATTEDRFIVNGTGWYK